MGGAGGFLDKLKKEGTRRGPTEDREGLSLKDMGGVRYIDICVL